MRPEPLASGGVEPDREQIAAFVQSIFRYAEGPFISLRAFGDGSDKATAIPIVRSIALSGDLNGLIDAAFDLALEAYRRPQGYVVCPPVATFTDPKKADEAHLAQGLALSVELDKEPAAGLARLRHVLGAPTLTIESGGITADGEPKLHAHWRLSEPATEDALATLKHARMLATAISGGDPSNISIAHPIRWPGTVHRKGAPRLATIVQASSDLEIHLDDALEALTEAAEAASLTIQSSGGPGEQTPRPKGRPDSERLREIATGASYYENLRYFSASLTRAGLSRARTQKLLDGFIDLVPIEARDDRWNARKAAIPELIDSAEGKFSPSSDRRLIVYAGGRLPQCVDAAADALGLHREANIFAYGETLVRLAMRDDGLGRPPRLAPVPLNTPALRDVLTRLCRFEKPPKPDEDPVEINCPKDVAESLAARGSWPRVRSLRGVAHSPIIRPDGTIAQREGYDSETGVFLDFRGVRYPDIPIRPHRGNAIEAVTRLKFLLDLYEWAGGPEAAAASRSACISLFLTAATRRTLDRAPGFLVTATAPGSGKGKIVDIASIIMTGAAADVICMKPGEDELPKVIDAALLSGAPMLALDDVEPEHLRGSALRGLLTAAGVTARPMRTSEFRAVPATILVTATGNSIVLAKDMVRRFIVATIDPGVENPEDRAFPFDPVAVAIANRPQIVADCLTILAAYHAAGAPAQNGEVFGTYENWSRSVRDALIWLGEADPVATSRAMRGTDPAREDLATLMFAWEEAFGARAVIASQAFETGSLKQAMEALGVRTSRELGDWLRRHKGKRLNDRAFITNGETRGSKRWQLNGAVGSGRRAGRKREDQEGEEGQNSIPRDGESL